MKIRVIILLFIVFFGVISAQETTSSDLPNIETKADSTDLKNNYDNYFNETDIAKIVDVIKAGDIFSLEYFFDSSEKKLLDFQLKYLLGFINTNIDEFAKKTITDKNLKQIATAFLVAGGLIYLEKNNYFENSGIGYRLGTTKEASSKIITNNIKFHVSKLFIPLKNASRYKTDLMKYITSKIYSKRTGIATISDKSHSDMIKDIARENPILAAIIVGISIQLITTGIYSTLGAIKSKVSEIFLYRRFLKKMYKIREIIVKQKTITVY